MHDEQRIRDLYDSLTPAQQAEVAALFAPEVARGWIPKPREVEDAIAQVVSKSDEQALESQRRYEA